MQSIQVSDSCSPKKVHRETFREFTWDDIVLPSELYTLTSEISYGTTFIVFKATHHDHGTVAVKVYRNEYKCHMENELQCMYKTQYKENFLKVLDTWEDDHYCYIAMPLVHGNVLDLIKEGMTTDEIMECVEQLADAIAIMHSCHIIHFDLKPEIIGFIRHRNGRIQYKIIDFGSAESSTTVYSRTFQEEINTKKTVCTSLYYRSYEAIVLDGLQQHTEKSDMWSFGCIIYEMMTGVPLFDKLNEAEHLDYNKNVIKRGLQKVDSISVYDSRRALLQKTMKYCLQPDVDERYEAYEVVQLFMSHV